MSSKRIERPPQPAMTEGGSQHDYIDGLQNKPFYNVPSAPAQINSPSEFYALSSQKQETLKTWIAKNLRPAKKVCRKISSYGLKHLFEADRAHGGFYVTNGQFKGAALACGYSPEFEHDTDWNFKITYSGVKAIGHVLGW